MKRDKEFQLRFKELVKRLKELEQIRYKALVLYGPPLCGKTTLAKMVCKEHGIYYIDFAGEVLPNIAFPTLGVYGANDFLNWIRQKANESQNYLCVDEIEPLLTTFPKKQAENFFSVLGRLETRYPILLVTRLESICKSNFPSERIYHFTL